jgi:hypothetical protein
MNARAVAQYALVDAQTASLIGKDHECLCILLSALNYIASNGEMYRETWHHIRRIIDGESVTSIADTVPCQHPYSS